MKAEIKTLYSPDVESLAAYSPVDPLNFGIYIQMLIGPRGLPGAEAFGIHVMSPLHLKSEIERKGAVWGGARLFMTRYDFDELKRCLTRFVENVDGDDWNAIAMKLARRTDWEFENYLPYGAD